MYFISNKINFKIEEPTKRYAQHDVSAGIFHFCPLNFVEAKVVFAAIWRRPQQQFYDYLP